MFDLSNITTSIDQSINLTQTQLDFLCEVMVRLDYLDSRWMDHSDEQIVTIGNHLKLVSSVIKNKVYHPAEKDDLNKLSSIYNIKPHVLK